MTTIPETWIEDATSQEGEWRCRARCTACLATDFAGAWLPAHHRQKARTDGVVHLEVGHHMSAGAIRESQIRAEERDEQERDHQNGWHCQDEDCTDCYPDGPNDFDRADILLDLMRDK